MGRGAFPDRRTYRLAPAPLPRADPAGVAHQQLVADCPPHVGEGGLLDGPGQGGRDFQRGFEVRSGERTLIVDDVLTTGGSIREVIEAVRRADGVPIGVGVRVDRSGGRTDFGLPLFACVELDLPSYDEGSCPLCDSGAALTVT